jgi:hypothetical protein
VFGGKDFSTGYIARRHRGHLDLFVIPGRDDERQRCDTGCAEDADPHPAPRPDTDPQLASDAKSFIPMARRCQSANMP